ncbi:MAG: hypothetical protein QOI74_1804 [Micromonosporaceae bacterium]|jgi:uncharacterized Zn finger protein|nr:hypothetical protein [Micromonosporaceae bacterium]
MSFADYGPPRRVTGGIRARSARGAIGTSWWSRRFLAVLESFALGTRLTRGRSYARAGQVLALTILPGTVTASVQGSRPTPYAVTIGLAPFDEPVWHAVERALAAQALFSAQLLAGEMPDEIEDVFAAAGAPLFPASIGELTLGCSCPDWSIPCKHLAATFYLLAEAFDTDPFQILYWRGRDRETLLTRLGILRGGAGSAAADAVVRIGSAMALADVTTPAVTDALDRYWLPPVPLPSRPPTLDVETDLLLRQLPEPGPELGGSTLVDRLRDAYRRFGSG